MSAESPRALMIDPDESAVIECARGLTSRGWTADYAPSFEETLSLIREFSYNLVLIELRLPDAFGLDVWTYIKKLYPETFGIIMTGSPTLHASVNAFTTGILSFSLKPLELNLVYNWAAYILDHQRARAENIELHRNLVGLGNLISSVAAACTGEQILQSALAHLPAVLKSDWIVVLMQRDGEAARSDWLWRNLAPGRPDLTRPQSELMEQLIHEAVDGQQAVLIDKSPTSEFKYGITMLRDLGLGSLMAAPIMGHSEVFGALGVINGPESKKILNTGEIQELTIIGRTVGLAFDRLHATEQLGVEAIGSRFGTLPPEFP